jgi:hypothetical protein
MLPRKRPANPIVVVGWDIYVNGRYSTQAGTRAGANRRKRLLMSVMPGAKIEIRPTLSKGPSR